MPYKKISKQEQIELTSGLLQNYSSHAPSMSTTNMGKMFGVAQSNMYWHFGSKNELLYSVMDYMKKANYDAYIRVVSREKQCADSFIHKYLKDKYN